MITSEIATLGERIAASALTALATDASRWAGPIPVEKLLTSRQARVQVSVRGSGDRVDRWHGSGLEGLVLQERVQGSPIGDNPGVDGGLSYIVEVADASVRSRFTLAHELAHIILAEICKDERSTYDVNLRERICNLAAGQILVPSAVIQKRLSCAPCVMWDIASLEQWSAGLQVSLAVLITRLDEVSRRVAPEMANGVLLVRSGLSRKKRLDLSPRVAARCLPRDWFIPFNKRLGTIGFLNLRERFYSATPFRQNSVQDTIVAWNQARNAVRTVRTTVEYKVYYMSSGERIMLCTVEFEDA